LGRALTAQWQPGRPDIERVIEEQGMKDGRIGGTNAWPVDMLQPGDVYVCDHFDLKQDGPSIGDNVGNAVYSRSHNGIVYEGAVRDINGLKELEEFTAFVRFYDPSHHFGMLAIGARLTRDMFGHQRLPKGNTRRARLTPLGPCRSRRTSPRGCGRTLISCRGQSPDRGNPETS
jgi:hypothetical protein